MKSNFVYPEEIVIKLTQHGFKSCESEIHSWKKAINGFQAECRLCGKILFGLEEINRYRYKI